MRHAVRADYDAIGRFDGDLSNSAKSPLPAPETARRRRLALAGKNCGDLGSKLAGLID